MRSEIARFAVITALLVGAATARAQGNQPHLVPFIGTGTLSCGEFVKYKESGNSEQLALFVQWTWGFMSAYSIRDNFVAKWKGVSKLGGLTEMPNDATVTLFIEKHCRERPLDKVMDAAVALTRALGGQIIWK